MTDFLNGIHYNAWILPALLIIPLVGALLVGAHGATRSSRAEADANAGPARQIAFWTLTIEFVVSCGLWWSFKIGMPGWQAGVDYAWIPAWGARFSVGIDGISLMLVLLTTLTMPLSILGGWTAIKSKIHAYLAVLLVLTTAMLGVFVARDLFFFYVMWEMMLIPMYLIIGIWGGQRRIYASLKFFIYTTLGSLLMLVAVIYLGVHNRDAVTGIPNFSLDAIIASGSLTPKASLWLFGGFFIAFAIKVPMFPFHTWLPDAHTEAPTAGSVILAGVLLKMGTYGFIRFSLPLLPSDAAARHTIVTILIVLSLIGIIYGALVCMMQKDMKKLIAYSSVSHLGFCTLGIFVLTPHGLSGSVIQQINHGISTGALFLLIGVLYERRHTRLISEFGGLSTPMPNFAAIYMIATLSSLGLPLLNGFIGEFTILSGVYQVSLRFAAWAVIGIIRAPLTCFGSTSA